VIKWVKLIYNPISLQTLQTLQTFNLDMLPKNRRIRREKIPEILKFGKRLHSPVFLLYWSTNDSVEEKQGKFSFSVSKKVCKDAVGRNKLRRQGYSVIADVIKNKKLAGYFLFSFKNNKQIPGFEVIKEDILNLLKDAPVLT